MPAPTNSSATTAIDLGSLPASASQDVHDDGTTYTVWYAFTTGAAPIAIGVWGFGALTGYTPRTFVYTGPAESPTLVHSGAINKPLQLVLQASTEYFFEFRTNTGNPSPAILAISALEAPDAAAAAGSIVIPDDIDGSRYPLAILSAADGTLLRMIPNFPASEQGDSLATGEILHSDINANNVQLFDGAFNVLVAPVGSLTDFSIIRANHGAGTFTVADGDDAHIVSAAGVVEATHTGIFSLARGAIAGSNDEALIYHARANTVSVPIERYDRIAEEAVSDLSAGRTDHGILDLLVLPDDSIIVSYYELDVGFTLPFRADRFAPNGDLLNTYELASETSHNLGPPRLAYGLTGATFWAWFHTGTGIGHFREVRVSDGAIVTSFDRVEYVGGNYDPAATETPADRFGNTSSCPIFLLRGAGLPGGGGGNGGGGPVPVIGPLVWVHWPRPLEVDVPSEGGS